MPFKELLPINDRFYFSNIYLKIFIFILSLIVIGALFWTHIEVSRSILEVEKVSTSIITPETNVNKTVEGTDAKLIPDDQEDELIANLISTTFIKSGTDEVLDEDVACYIANWNNITTDTIPYSEANKELLTLNKGNQLLYLYATFPSVLAAFAYKDFITITLTSETYYGRKVYCRYFDCNRQEILNPFHTTVFPEMTVHCGRRAGAEYISVSESLEEEPEYPVPIIRRTEPQHFFTVCMAPLYGDEPKFLQIADFIEYYKLQGATLFHIYVRNVTEYDQLILDDYVRTGEVELIKMHDHFWREDFMWHHPQINDCHRRNQYFSKWTAFIDLDERIEIKNSSTSTIADFLMNVTDPEISSIILNTQWIVKDQYSPERYINDTQITEEMLFRKYHNTSHVEDIFLQAKSIVRPETVAIMDIHTPSKLYKGKFSYVSSKTAVVRHYRNNRAGALVQSNVDRMEKQGPFHMSSIDPLLEKSLTEKVLNRIKNVYANRQEMCDQLQFNIWINRLKLPCWIN